MKPSFDLLKLRYFLVTFQSETRIDWKPTYKFEDLVKEMVESDIAQLSKVN